MEVATATIVEQDADTTNALPSAATFGIDAPYTEIVWPAAANMARSYEEMEAAEK